MPPPFENISFCTTSLHESVKKGILKKMIELGGKYESDLTNTVTVLVVGERFTNKYIYCLHKRPDVKFISPQTISELHDAWWNVPDGEEDIVKFNLEDYMMSVFEGLNFCLARVNTDQYVKASQTDEIAKVIQDNGGKVDSALQQSSDCLISNERSGKRYQFCERWKIKVIHPLWVLHSAERGAAFPWDTYDIDAVGVDRIGKQSLDILKQMSRLKDLTENMQTAELPLIEAGSKSMLMVPTKKNSRLWNTMMEETVDGVEAKNKKQQISEWDVDVDGDENPILQTSIKSTISTYSKVNEEKLKMKPLAKLQFKPLPPAQQQHQQTVSNLFSGLSFKVEHFDTKKAEILAKVIRSYSGQVTDSKSPSFLVIPYDYPIDLLSASTRRILASKNPMIKVVTEWFFERSLHYNQLKYDTWTKPFYRSPRFTNPRKLYIAISGFGGVELLHVKKLIALLPNHLELSEYLNETRDVLVINSAILNIRHPNLSPEEMKFPDLLQPIPKSDVQLASSNSLRKKISYAKQKRIPLVRVGFLFEFFMCENNELPLINVIEWGVFVPRGDDIKENIKPYLNYNSSVEENTLVANYHSRDRHQMHTEVEQKQDDDENTPEPMKMERPKLGNDVRPKLVQSGSSMLPKLPSPLCHKPHSGGRLFGRAEISQFDTIRSNKNSDESSKMCGFNSGMKDIVDLENEDIGTQINYDDSNVSKSGNDSDHVKRRSTRARTKEMMNILE